MLWEIDIFPAAHQPDVHGKTVVQDALDLGLSDHISVKTAYGYLIEGTIGEPQIKMLAEQLLADPIAETFTFDCLCEKTASDALYVLPKPGVTDSVAENAKKIIADFGVAADAVRTFKKYWINGADETEIKLLATKLLANDAVEEWQHFTPAPMMRDKPRQKANAVIVPLRRMSGD
ncbi:MAG: hypothetical protein LBT89_08660, partial [Planctomycetaceae bacterium]|nr:hypothetical protein [Planctomycetaceae bacterium]